MITFLILPPGIHNFYEGANLYHNYWTALALVGHLGYNSDTEGTWQKDWALETPAAQEVVAALKYKIFTKEA